MRRNFYQSLDRPVDIFGLKGRWIMIFLFVCLGFLFLGIVLGCVFGTAYGLLTVILGVFLSFGVCFYIQLRVPHRRISKYMSSSVMSFDVSRRETLCHIFYRSDEPSWFAGPYLDELRKVKDGAGESAEVSK